MATGLRFLIYMLRAILAFELTPGQADSQADIQRGWYIIPRCNQFGYTKGVVNGRHSRVKLEEIRH